MNTFTITAGNLRRLLAPVILAAADRRGPEVLQTVRVQVVSGGRVRASASNRYIVAWAEVDTEEVEGTAEFLLLADDVKRLLAASKPAPRGRVFAETPVTFTAQVNDPGDVYDGLISEVAVRIGQDALNFRIAAAEEYPPALDRIFIRWNRRNCAASDVTLDGKWLDVVAKGAAIVGEHPHVELGEDMTKPVAVTVGADLLYLIGPRRPEDAGEGVLGAWVGRLS